MTCYFSLNKKKIPTIFNCHIGRYRSSLLTILTGRPALGETVLHFSSLCSKKRSTKCPAFSILICFIQMSLYTIYVIYKRFNYFDLLVNFVQNTIYKKCFICRKGQSYKVPILISVTISNELEYYWSVCHVLYINGLF